MLQRNNQQWVSQLRGDHGQSQQRQAHEALANYLYVVAFNYLRLRQTSLPALAAFAAPELSALAQDFVQEALEKLARNNHALLSRYRGAGRFTSWAAQIVRNQAAQELRKSYWTRRSPLPQAPGADDEDERQPLMASFVDTSPDIDPAYQATYQQIRQILQRCLERLSARYRLAILNCVVDDRPAAAVAEALDTTANAVYLIVRRAKQQLRQCLEAADIGPEALAVFKH